MWRRSLTENPRISFPLLSLLLFLNALTLIPPVASLAVLLSSYLMFSCTLFVAKSYVRAGGRLRELEAVLRRATFPQVVFGYAYETLAVLIAQTALGILALFVAFVVLTVGGVWSVLLPLLEGRVVSWSGIVLSVFLAFFLYFSLVSSFPLFFGRAVLKGEGFRSTLRLFVESLYRGLSWRTLLNADYLKSSVLISLISCLFILLHGIVLLFPFTLPAGSVLSFLTVHLLYTFGTVACFRLLRS